MHILLLMEIVIFHQSQFYIYIKCKPVWLIIMNVSCKTTQDVSLLFFVQYLSRKTFIFFNPPNVYIYCVIQPQCFLLIDFRCTSTTSVAAAVSINFRNAQTRCSV